MALASDLDNRDFIGAVDPNEMLQVEFYNHAALDTWATNQSGLKTYLAECPFIRIAIPGNDKTIVERPADGRDTNKYPRQWLVFQMQSGMIANAENVPGWQIEDWDELNPEQVRQLKFLRFYTVEQIAGANDTQIQGIGMGGLALREKAKRALAIKNASAVNDAVAVRDEEIEAFKLQMAVRDKEIEAFKLQMAELMAMVKGDTEDRPKRGRPPHVKEDD